MIDDIHIDDFSRDTALIFLYLYRQFPRKSELYVEDITGPDDPDEYGLHSTRHLSCFSTMIWLAEEGFIRYGDTIRQEALDQVILCQKTFLCLTSIHDDSSSYSENIDELPESLKTGHLSHISKIKRSLKSEDSHQIRNTIMDILGKL